MTPLLTEGEAADMMQMSGRSIRKARQTGKLPYVQLGRLVRYRVEDLQTFIERCTVANDPAVTRNSGSRCAAPGQVVPFTSRNARR